MCAGEAPMPPSISAPRQAGFERVIDLPKIQSHQEKAFDVISTNRMLPTGLSSRQVHELVNLCLPGPVIRFDQESARDRQACICRKHVLPWPQADV